MHFTPLLSVYCLATLALSQSVDWRDIPGVCSPVCYAVVNLAQSCEHNGSNDYITCACIAAVWRDNTNVNSLLSSCSFTATTWTGATTGTEHWDHSYFYLDCWYDEFIVELWNFNSSASGTSSTASEFTGAAAPVMTACLGIAYAMMGLPAIL
ncbi:hypothetical protein GTA08_BOTSDO02856 [Neofusicoccum parvum]|nr:hypothetical protein GTA08_BOTSDO02856 [Neofusicoccum parvum]